MRYIKKLALNKKDPENDRFSVLADNRIVTNTKVSLQLPVGAKVDRPAPLDSDDGMIRYNKDLKELEVYNSANPGPYPWEILRTVRQSNITMQDLGQGNYSDNIFGPLSYDVSISKPQNIFVFVDNVYQVPISDYILTINPPSVTAILTTATLTNIDTGKPGTWRTISGNGIQIGSTVTNISLQFDYIRKGYPVEISLPAITTISSGTIATVSYSAGTFIQFTGPVPSQQVFALLGFDGYFPAGPTGDSWES
jgi:hypothetical protein